MLVNIGLDTAENEPSEVLEMKYLVSGGISCYRKETPSVQHANRRQDEAEFEDDSVETPLRRQ